MEYVLNILNKIKWDKNLNPEEYIIIYIDRLKKTKKEIKFKDIKEFNNFTLITEDKEIPLHRIREIKKQGKIIWKREKCYICEKGNLEKKKIDYKLHKMLLGKFDAKICNKCEEIFFNEETSKKMTRIAKERKLWKR